MRLSFTSAADHDIAKSKEAAKGHYIKLFGFVLKNGLQHFMTFNTLPIHMHTKFLLNLKQQEDWLGENRREWLR